MGQQCPGGGGDCCVSNGSPGCDDVACCEAVCAIDSFCCDIFWDSTCAGEAQALCVVLCAGGGPLNDDCANRLTIEQNVLTPFDTTLAITDGLPTTGLGDCAAFGDPQIYNDIWYNFTPTQDLTYDISLCGSSYNTKMVVYSGCLACPADPATEIACNDDFCGVQSQVKVSLLAGQCYKIRVGGSGAGDSGTGTILISKQVNPPACDDPNSGDCCSANGSPGCDRKECCAAICDFDPFCCNHSWDVFCAIEAAADPVNCPQCQVTPPPNDNCADRELIEQDVLTLFDTSGATTDGPPTCALTGQDIWYNFTPAQSLTYDISLCGSSFDTVLAVYDGCTCPADPANEIACNDDFCGLQSQVKVDLIGGQCYKIRVGGFAANASSGAGQILITKQLPPPGGFLDIKPGSCPNSFNRNSNGVLPVALVGTVSFDVTQVDISSIQLVRKDGEGGSVAPNEGPPGPHSVFADVATPFGGELCDCHEETGDGIDDLMMHFKTADVVAALELNNLPAGDLVSLTLIGNLLDGTPFEADDCIRLVPPGTAPGLLAVGSNLVGAWLDVTPLDETLDGGGFAIFERTYPLTTVVTLTAPPTHNGWVFIGWWMDGALHAGQSIDITIQAKQQAAKALYAPAGPTGATIVP